MKKGRKGERPDCSERKEKKKNPDMQHRFTEYNYF